MNVKKRRNFLFISNIVISVLAAAAIVGCFVLPIWKVEFSASFTDEVGEALKSVVYVEEKSGAAIRLTSDGESSKTEISDLLPDVFSGSGRDVFLSFVDALCEAKLQLHFSQSFSSVDMFGALYDQDPSRAADVIDDSVDSFIDAAENIISDFMSTAVKVAAKEVVKSTVDSMLRSNYEGESYEDLMAELGSDKDRIEALIERVIDAVMKEDATVDSVTNVVLESADEAKEILSKIPKFSESAGSYDDDARKNVKQSAEELLGQFADKDGKIYFKDSLIQMLLNASNQAIEELQNSTGGVSASDSAMSLTTGAESEKTVEQSADELKTKIKKAAFNTGDGVAAKLIVGAMAVSGALLAILLFMLFYPILRTLTNIGAENPGFNMFLPIFGGIASYMTLVILPSVIPNTLKLLGLYGDRLSLPPAMIAVLNAVSLDFSSGTVIAFIFALALFVFSFFYEHQRRALKKELILEEKMMTAEAAEQQ